MRTNGTTGKNTIWEWRGYLLAVALVVIATWLKYLAEPNIIPANVPILYILAIVFTATSFGLGPSFFCCLLSLLAYDFFFLSPIHVFTFRVSVIPILLVFLTTGLVISYLSSNLRKRTDEATREVAIRKQKEAELILYKNHLEDLVKQRTTELEKTNLDLKDEIAERKKAEQTISRQNATVDAINHIFRECLACETEEQLALFCLNVAVELTHSRFGFLGEIGADGMLHDVAMNNPGWDICAMADKTGHRRAPGNFTIHGLYGRVLDEGKSLLVNTPSSHPDSIGTPPGHPPLTAFLGVPLSSGGKIIGMLGLANREGGYRPEDQAAMETLAPAIVEATMRKIAEEALRESEESLKRAQEIAHLGSWELDLVNNRLAWSDEVYRIFGLRPQEFAATYEAFLDAIHPEDRAAVDTAYSSSIKEGRDTYEIEHRIERKPAGETRYVFERCQHVRDERGKIIRSIGMVHDITERKVAEDEVKRRTAELEASNKELEAFSYSVSHDLRAPLRSMEGFSNALLEDYAGKLDDQGKQYLSYVQESSELMARLIDDLLKLSRVTRSEMSYETVNLSEIARKIVGELKKNEPDRRVQVSVAPDITAQGDPNLLRVMLENLLGNAWKFTSKEAAPQIQIGTIEHNGRPACFIRDNGVGFDMTYANKLFQPFQRLHKTTEFAGTGIGLATVQRIVRRHGGEIWAEGEVGKGATFYFTLS